MAHANGYPAFLITPEQGIALLRKAIARLVARRRARQMRLIEGKR